MNREIRKKIPADVLEKKRKEILSTGETLAEFARSNKVEIWALYAVLEGRVLGVTGHGLKAVKALGLESYLLGAEE